MAEPSSFTLWNPDVAALLSLILSPTFGAIIHALNWRSLGQPKKAYVSWGWAFFSFFGMIAAAIFLQLKFGDGKTFDRLMGVASFVVLVVWYFSFGRSQSKFVTRQLNGRYVKAGWFNVFCIVIIFYSSLFILNGQFS